MKPQSSQPELGALKTEPSVFGQAPAEKAEGEQAVSKLHSPSCISFDPSHPKQEQHLSGLAGGCLPAQEEGQASCTPAEQGHLSPQRGQGQHPDRGAVGWARLPVWDWCVTGLNQSCLQAEHKQSTQPTGPILPCRNGALRRPLSLTALKI